MLKNFKVYNSVFHQFSNHFASRIFISFQVWAYTLGIGDLVPRKKLRHHLEMEVEINDSPWGLKIIDDKRFAPAEEDTSLILSYRFAGCENLENVSKHKSIWMGADADWASMMIHLGM